jgi:hypothetical protein
VMKDQALDVIGLPSFHGQGGIVALTREKP